MDQREEIDIMRDDTVPKKNKKGKKLLKSDSSVTDIPVKK
jgi:hypothetical protein